MTESINTLQLVTGLRSDRFFVGCNIPFGYSANFPIVQRINGRTVLTVPFLKYKTTGIPDKTLVFPLRYCISFTVPDKKFIRFEDLSYNQDFENVNFQNPIGYFRHDSIKSYTRSEYTQKKTELYMLYDIIIAASISGMQPSEEDAAAFSGLLTTLLEPALKPYYQAIDRNFYRKYLI